MPETKMKPAARSAKPKEKPEETAAPKPAETPDWVNETVDDTSYSLTMYESGGGGSVEDIDMDRGEFIRLKRWLAALRGYELRSPRNSWDYNHGGQSPEERQALALNITQLEIQVVMDLEHIADRLVVNLRRRLALGAEIEKGEWHLVSGSSPIDDRDELPYSGSSRLLKKARHERFLSSCAVF